jgi:hypothetical protein
VRGTQIQQTDPDNPDPPRGTQTQKPQQPK